MMRVRQICAPPPAEEQAELEHVLESLTGDLGGM